jgi:hypothetical protein
MSSQEALALVPHSGYEESQLVVVCGQKGFGKTWWLRHYAYAEPRLLVIDIHDEFPQVTLRLNYQDALDDLAEDTFPCWRRVIPPHDVSTFEWGERFLSELLKSGASDLLLVIPEISAYTRTKGGIEGAALEKIILRGRHYRIRLAVDVQRLNRAPGELHSELTQAVIYHTRRPRDLDVLESWGVEDAHEVLPALPKYRCYLLRG